MNARRPLLTQPPHSTESASGRQVRPHNPATHARAELGRPVPIMVVCVQTIAAIAVVAFAFGVGESCEPGGLSSASGQSSYADPASGLSAEPNAPAARGEFKEIGASYLAPERAALDIVYLGSGVFLDESERVVLKTNFERALHAHMSAPEGRRLLQESVLAFLRRIASDHPDLLLRVADPGKPQVLGDSLDRTAFASVALSRAAVVEAVYGSGESDRTYYVALPVVLVGARSFELIYARPLFVRLKHTHGVDETDAALQDRILAAAATFIRETAADPPTAAVAAQCLRHGAFRSPGGFTYAVEPVAVTFSASATNALTGFRQPAQVAELLRFAFCHHLSQRERVYPPIDAPVAARNLRGVAARYYGLGVVTDLQQETGLARSESGLLVLPVRRPEADFSLQFEVATDVVVQSRGTHYQVGRCEAGLKVTRLSAGGPPVAMGSQTRSNRFYASIGQDSHLADDTLVECLLKCSELLGHSPPRGGP